MQRSRRCIIPIKPKNVDARLKPKNLAALYAILDDRAKPYCEHRMAASGESTVGSGITTVPLWSKADDEHWGRLPVEYFRCDLKRLIARILRTHTRCDRALLRTSPYLHS